MTKIRVPTTALLASAKAMVEIIDAKRAKLREEHIKKRVGIRKFCGIQLYEVTAEQAAAEWNADYDHLIYENQRDRCVVISNLCRITSEQTIALSLDDAALVHHRTLFDKCKDQRLSSALPAQTGCAQSEE